MPDFQTGDRVVILNTQLYNGRHGFITQKSDDPEDFWDHYVHLFQLGSLNSRIIGVFEHQVKHA